VENIQELVGYQRAEFDHAGRLFRRKFAAQVLLAVVGATSTFISNEKPLFWVAMICLVIALIWLLIELNYRNTRANAERARRATLIMGGLGAAISKSELHYIQESMGSTPEEARANEDPDYFSSQKPPGPQRLTDMLEESAYWTVNLQRDSGKVMFVLFFLVLAAALFSFSLLISETPNKELLTFWRVVCSILIFCVSSDMFGQVRAYQDTVKTLDRLLLRIEIAKKSRYPQADVLLILSDYNAVVENTPLTLPLLYRIKKVRLKSNWQKRTVVG
jgi:hypothetical protein